MNSSFGKFILVVALALGVCALVSCKKEASERPERFESGVHGVAVQPLPPIDEAMANVSLDDLDAVPSHRSTGLADDSYVPAEATRSSDEFDGEDAGDVDADEEIADDFSFGGDDFDDDDANSF